VASSLRTTAKSAAVPPKLISDPGDSAAAGSAIRRINAAKVSEADGDIARSSVRAPAPAVNIIQARKLGGSQAAINV
jgi:hypothetical protein